MPKVSDVIVRKPNPEEIEQAKAWPTWQCDKSVFDWDYTQQETCYILEGQVTVKDRPGNDKVTFGPGDWVILPKDLACVWDVKTPVKKHYKFDS